MWREAKGVCRQLGYERVKKERKKERKKNKCMIHTYFHILDI